MSKGRSLTPCDTPVGTLGGLCNRTACRRPGATWFNTGTRKHYCGRCAGLINSACLEYGEPKLCIKPERHAAEQDADREMLGRDADFGLDNVGNK